MSRGAQVAIAVSALVFAASFLALALYAGALFPVGPWPFVGLSAFCGAIAVACLFPGSRPFTLRIVGVVIFLVYVAYVYDTREEMTVLRALRGLLIWGLPCGYLAIWGVFPSWGRASKAFGVEQRPGN